MFAFSISNSNANYSSFNLTDKNVFEKQLNQLLIELDLTWDQKLSLGIITLKHSSQFDFVKFEKSGKFKQMRMVNKAIKKLEKEIKPILSKEQYTTYKKHKKQLRKSLLKSGR